MLTVKCLSTDSPTGSVTVCRPVHPLVHPMGYEAVGPAPLLLSRKGAVAACDRCGASFRPHDRPAAACSCECIVTCENDNPDDRPPTQSRSRRAPIPGFSFRRKAESVRPGSGMRSGEVVPRGPPPSCRAAAQRLRGRSEHDADPELGGGDRLDHGLPAPCAAELPVPTSTGSQSESHPLTTRRSRRPFVVTPVVAALAALAASGDAAAGDTETRRSWASQCAQGDSNSHGLYRPQGPQLCGAAPVVPVPLSEALSVRRPRRVGRIGRCVCYRGCYRRLPAGLGQPLATPPPTAPLSLGLWNRRGDFVLRRCRPRWPRAATEESDVGDDERHHEVQGTSRIGGRGRGAVQERCALVDSGGEQADDGSFSESA